MSKLYQYSHFWAVTNGYYEGELSIAELKKKGNYGLGTFNSLNGELVVIDDHYFQCIAGIVSPANYQDLLPWAAVSYLEIQKTISISNINTNIKLEEFISQNIPSLNYPYLISIEGTCENIMLGSVPKQSKPYRPISEVISDSITIETGKIDVDIIGFYTPIYMYPMKSSGLHLHFVSKNRMIGGHILDLHIQKASMKIQLLSAFEIILPQHENYKILHLPEPTQKQDTPAFVDKLSKSTARI